LILSIGFGFDFFSPTNLTGNRAREIIMEQSKEMKKEEKKTETYDFILTFNFKFVVGYSNILFVQQTKTKHNRKRNNTQT